MFTHARYRSQPVP